MIAKRILLYMFSIFLFTTPFYAQHDESDSTANYNEWDWEDDWEWNWEDKWIDFDFDRPLIELNYGLGKPSNKNFNSNFARSGMIELKLGYSTIYNEFDDQIIKFKDKFILLSRISDKLNAEDAGANEVTTEIYKFGFGHRKGYGYALGGVDVIFYNQNTYDWSQLSDFNYPTSPVALSSGSDLKILNRYYDNFRFGTGAEGGVKFEIASLVSLNASYEALIIFPRYMIWKHLGSFIVENAGMVLIDEFVEEITERTPFAGPIINFLLKSGYSYGFYLLKKDKMNWPFNTETPLTHESFKIGVTFTF